jgi:hypothetical protein
MFYDIQHLNRPGAAKLTTILCDEIKQLNLLPPEPVPTRP